VEVGDEIAVLAGADGRVYRYRVTAKLLLQEKGVSNETRINNGRWISPTEDERLTLVTCAGPGASHRLIVIAQPIAADY
jgi:sortase (surface protein transpeptidase)